VGKSTIFNALTSAGAQASNYPFTTIDPNVGVVDMPDERLDKLAEIYVPKKLTPTSMEFVDIAGLVKGASRAKAWATSSSPIYAKWTRSRMWCAASKTERYSRREQGGPQGRHRGDRSGAYASDLDAIEKRLYKAEKLVKTGIKRPRMRLLLCAAAQDMLAKGEPIRRATHSDEETLWLQDLRTFVL